MEMAQSNIGDIPFNHQHLTSFIHRHERSISIAFVIWCVGSSYRREPRGLEAPKGLLKLRVWLQVWKLLKQLRISLLPNWKGVNMTALESGDLEMRTRPSMRSIPSISFSQHSPHPLLQIPAQVTQSCSSARSLLGKASSLTSEAIWKLFLAISILTLLLPHPAIKLGLISKQSVRIGTALISIGKSDSMS